MWKLIVSPEFGDRMDLVQLATFRRKNEQLSPFRSGFRVTGVCKVVQTSVLKHF